MNSSGGIAAPVATRAFLARLRATAAAIDAGALVAIWIFRADDFPLARAWAVIAASLAANIVVAAALWKRGTAPRPIAVVGLAIDILLLTTLIDLTGGPSNPFVVVYVVHIALAVVTIGTMPASALGAFAVACYGVLVYWHLHEAGEEHHHRLNDLPTHLFAVWVGVQAGAELYAHVVGRASDALRAHERELETMRVRAARADRLIALTTLAAGAAHELSTPLATIAVSARELERAAASAGRPSLADDAQLIRQQVDRCQAILDQMSGRAGGIAAAAPESFDVAAAVDELRSRLPAAARDRLDIAIAPVVPRVHLPRAGFGQAVASLVKNAFDASAGAARVHLDIAGDGDRLRVVVRDSGAGMQPEVLERAGEPFFTTKESGRGLGLGVFLARVFAERLGGSLTFTSDRGTTAVLEVPVRAAET
ncbi:MAG TPA: ATP-binding protein [Vicinamibacterales bacterium]|nr:ATP-binding protein [Vicinamibacterales bacterium]